jgi:predicted ATPase
MVKAASEGKLSQAIAEEGGMESILWAGPKKEGPVRMSVAVRADPFEYELVLGLKPLSEMPLFPLDPQIKREIVKLGGQVLVDRKKSSAFLRTANGTRQQRTDLRDSESIFAQLGDPEDFHYLYNLRELVARWTFYHEFRTDASSRLRRPALATYSSQLKEDGSNLAPMLYIVNRRGGAGSLHQILSSAFPGTRFSSIEGSELVMEVEGIVRPLTVREFSDGTLRFLCNAAACFALHPAPLIAFNEPETSLNPGLFGALADILAHAAQFSQLWITTHSEGLNKALIDRVACRPIRLDKVEGETVRAGMTPQNIYRAEEEDEDEDEVETANAWTVRASTRPDA